MDPVLSHECDGFSNMLKWKDLVEASGKLEKDICYGYVRQVTFPPIKPPSYAPLPPKNNTLMPPQSPLTLITEECSHLKASNPLKVGVRSPLRIHLPSEHPWVSTPNTAIDLPVTDCLWAGTRSCRGCSGFSMALKRDPTRDPRDLLWPGIFSDTTRTANGVSMTTTNDVTTLKTTEQASSSVPTTDSVTSAAGNMTSDTTNTTNQMTSPMTPDLTMVVMYDSDVALGCPSISCRARPCKDSTSAE
ncbi:hypothetical protein Bbelb_216420, partial [Branchiostoma belcheri]